MSLFDLNFSLRLTDKAYFPRHCFTSFDGLEGGGGTFKPSNCLVDLLQQPGPATANPKQQPVECAAAKANGLRRSESPLRSESRRSLAGVAAKCSGGGGDASTVVVDSWSSTTVPVEQSSRSKLSSENSTSTAQDQQETPNHHLQSDESVGMAASASNSGGYPQQAMTPFRDEDQGGPNGGVMVIENGQLVPVADEDEARTTRFTRSSYHHPHPHEALHQTQFDPLETAEFQEGCIDRRRFHDGVPVEYIRQYSPQSNEWSLGGQWPLGEQQRGLLWNGDVSGQTRMGQPNMHHMRGWPPEQTSPRTKSASGGSKRSDSVTVGNGTEISDDTLAQLSVKELNKRVQNLARDEVVMLKQRRRTLKNRGYAMNCRLRRQHHKESLEIQVNSLNSKLKKVENERDFYRAQLEKVQAASAHAHENPINAHVHQLHAGQHAAAAAAAAAQAAAQAAGGQLDLSINAHERYGHQADVKISMSNDEFKKQLDLTGYNHRVEQKMLTDIGDHCKM